MLAKECMKLKKKLLKTTMKKDIWKQTCLTFAREGSIPRIDIENECSYQMNRIESKSQYDTCTNITITNNKLIAQADYNL